MCIILAYIPRWNIYKCEICGPRFFRKSKPATSKNGDKSNKSTQRPCEAAYHYDRQSKKINLDRCDIQYTTTDDIAIETKPWCIFGTGFRQIITFVSNMPPSDSQELLCHKFLRQKINETFRFALLRSCQLITVTFDETSDYSVDSSHSNQEKQKKIIIHKYEIKISQTSVWSQIISTGRWQITRGTVRPRLFLAENTCSNNKKPLRLRLLNEAFIAVLRSRWMLGRPPGRRV